MIKKPKQRRKKPKPKPQVSQKQKTTQKQITIVKIDNRKQVRQRSNAVSAPPPPVLRGVSAQPQPIIPLPPPPDLYESNVLRQRIERLERVREPVRQPIRATIETQTEAPAVRGVSAQTIDPPVIVPIPPAPPPLTSQEVFERGRIFGEEQQLEIQQQMYRAGRRFEANLARERLRPVPDQPIRAEPAPAPKPPSPAPTEQLEPASAPAPAPAPAPSAFGRTLDRKQLRSIGVTRPQVLSKMGISLDEYKTKIFDKSFDMTNRGYNALVASEKKRVRDAVLSQDYGVI